MKRVHFPHTREPPSRNRHNCLQNKTTQRFGVVVFVFVVVVYLTILFVGEKRETKQKKVS